MKHTKQKSLFVFMLCVCGGGGGERGPKRDQMRKKRLKLEALKEIVWRKKKKKTLEWSGTLCFSSTKQKKAHYNHNNS